MKTEWIERASKGGFSFDDLIELVHVLRGPDGCAWDAKQTAPGLTRYFIEEVHEAICAILTEDQDHLAEELGDVLFQVAFQIVLGESADTFKRQAVLDGICRKLIHRHPHVFLGDQVRDDAARAQLWARQKAQELVPSIPMQGWTEADRIAWQSLARLAEKLAEWRQSSSMLMAADTYWKVAHDFAAWLAGHPDIVVSWQLPSRDCRHADAFCVGDIDTWIDGGDDSQEHTRQLFGQQLLWLSKWAKDQDVSLEVALAESLHAATEPLAKAIQSALNQFQKSVVPLE